MRTLWLFIILTVTTMGLALTGHASKAGASAYPYPACNFDAHPPAVNLYGYEVAEVDAYCSAGNTLYAPCCNGMIFDGGTQYWNGAIWQWDLASYKTVVFPPVLEAYVVYTVKCTATFPVARRSATGFYVYTVNNQEWYYPVYSPTSYIDC